MEKYFPLIWFAILFVLPVSYAIYLIIRNKRRKKKLYSQTDLFFMQPYMDDINKTEDKNLKNKNTWKI